MTKHNGGPFIGARSYDCPLSVADAALKEEQTTALHRIREFTTGEQSTAVTYLLLYRAVLSLRLQVLMRTGDRTAAFNSLLCG
ncbi:hypothetical protein F2P81_001192 [Scophthalmus maximus]|uniref:Uncharacterized protein n=1 Tax=Scophthalmus maximus TaxID=52904 RepID=A0A6A4TRN1_SCOMX|nr:hypothetical protein F2P81_001192 [Scophthalmus maximus]